MHPIHDIINLIMIYLNWTWINYLKIIVETYIFLRQSYFITDQKVVKLFIVLIQEAKQKYCFKLKIKFFLLFFQKFGHRFFEQKNNKSEKLIVVFNMNQ